MRSVCGQFIGVLSAMVFALGVGSHAGESAPVLPVGEGGNAVSLEISAENSGPTGNALCPPPGTYDIPGDDIVLLQGRRNGNPDLGPRWSGAVSGSAPVVALPMHGAKGVTAAFDGGGTPPGEAAPVFNAPDRGALHAFLGSGDLHGWFSVNRSRSDMGAGITHLSTADNPYFPVFARPNLNFEHILNGAAADAARSENTPRTDPIQVRLLSPACVELYWPAASSSWKIDCRMRYAFSGNNAIDMDFEAIPRAQEAPHGWLMFMWASYMQMARARTLYFRGTEGGAEKWVSFGKTGESGAVAGVGQPELSHDDGPEWFNVSATSRVRFTLPVYYGLRDADMDPGTTEDTMAYIMMFDEPLSTRFAIWNWGQDPTVSAWDWQFIVHDPEPGRSYRHHARMVYKRFAGEEDVLAEYESWRGALAAGTHQTSLPVTPSPVCLAPGDSAYNHSGILKKVAAADPGLAIQLCKKMLTSTLYGRDAANCIDACADKERGPAGAADQWAAIAAEYPRCAVAWRHLGMAMERIDAWAQAAAAYGTGLALDAVDAQTRMRLGIVRVRLGETDAGLALLDEAVGLDGTLRAPAARECAELAESRFKADDSMSAIALYRKAVAYQPDDTAQRMLLGQALESTGDVKGALDQYRQVAERSPESAHAATRIDDAYRKMDDGAGLVAEWKGLSGTHPGSAVAGLHLGLALEAAGDAAGAEAAYQELLRRHPEQPQAKVRLGGLTAAAGESDKGLRMMEEALSNGSPEDAEFAAAACGDAAQKRMAAGDAAGGVTLLRRACRFAPSAPFYFTALGKALETAGDLSGAETAYGEALRLNPERQEPKLRLGALVAARGDVAAGLRLLDEAVGVLPGLAAAAAEACDFAAKARQAAGDVAGTTTLLRRACSLSPEVPLYGMDLGEALEAAGDESGALAAYRAVVAEAEALPSIGERIDALYQRRGDLAGRVTEWKGLVQAHPDAAVPQWCLGMALEASGDGGGAEAAYREALRLRPAWVEPKLRLGAVVAAKGDVDAGLRLLDEAVGAMPDLAGLAAEACGRAAKARLAAGDAPGAVSLLRRARSLSPPDLRYRVALGGALEASGDDTAALEEYRAVVAEVPESPHSSDRIDAIHDRRRDVPGRVTEWRRMVENHPGAAIARLHLGLALEVAGDGAGAEAAYRGALSQNSALDAASVLFSRIKAEMNNMKKGTV